MPAATRNNRPSLARALAVALVAACGIAQAQEFPSRTVRLIVPSQPGGIADLAARVLGNKLGEYWKQSVVIENRGGGNGMIGMELAAKVAPDGYSILCAAGSDYTIIPHFYGTERYSTLRDFAPVSLVTDNPLVIVAGSGVPFNTIGEMLAHARSQPGGLAYSTPGTGSHNHLIGERFARETGTKLLHVPYKGGGPAAGAIASGDVPIGILATGTVMSHIKAGRMKVIAATTARRIAIGPEWPTLAESGVPGFDASNWIGVALPSAAPRELVARLNADLARALKESDVRERLSAAGSEAIGTSPEQLAARIRADSERYGKLIRDLRLKLE